MQNIKSNNLKLKNMNSITLKLEVKIHEFIRENGKMCSTIVMHPATLEKVTEERVGMLAKHDYKVVDSLTYFDIRYRGVRVIRSIDISEDEFILGI